MSNSEEILRRRRRFGIAALVILLWVACFVAITHYCHVPFYFSFLHPFTVIESFLIQWYDWAWGVSALLALLPLIGWMMLFRNVRAGRYVLIGSLCVILIMDAIITPLHLFNDMGLYNMFGGRMPSNLGMTALLGLVCAVYPVVVIILTHKWKPKIK